MSADRYFALLRCQLRYTGKIFFFHFRPIFHILLTKLLCDCRLNRLLSGCTLLRTHPLIKQLDRKAGIPYSIMCECGQAPQDIEHYLLECNLMNQEREQLVQSLMELILKNNLKYQKVSVDLLLGDLEDVPKSVSIEVRRAVLCYLTDTCSKIKI